MRILVVDDESLAATLIKGWLIPLGHEIDSVINGKSLLTAKQAENYDVILIDKQMPDIDGLVLGKQLKEKHPHLVTIMTTGFETQETLIHAFRDSHFDDYLSKPFQVRHLQDALLRAQNLIRERKALSNAYQLNQALRLKTIESSQDFIGRCAQIQKVFQMVEKVAQLDVAILIMGETGTGKEMLAREIYKRSHLGRFPFVAVNCAAIPSELFESELFGHEKGAFTGAYEKKEGLLKLADGGTLFLDEVGEISIQLQVKLLRFLQEGEILPVGGNKTIKVKTRIISATNKNLEKEIEKGNFREDLYYRLNEFSVNLPPLRERSEDMLPLVQHLIEKHSHLNSRVKGMTAEAVRMLQMYSWRGNIRELGNKVKRAMALSEREFLSVEDFPQIYQSLLKQKTYPLSSDLEKVVHSPETNLMDTRKLPAQKVAWLHHCGENYEALWKSFLSHDSKLWKFENLSQARESLKQILENADYRKVGHFGCIQVAQDCEWKIDLSYVSPVTQSVELASITFQFFADRISRENIALSPSTGETGKFKKIVTKGLPDSYLFNLLFPPPQRYEPISISQAHIIRALVLRYALGFTSNKPLKKIFSEVMPILIDPPLTKQFTYLPYDGLEALRSCLSSKVHVFSGISSKLKANRPLVIEEIQKVFPDYDIRI